MEAMAGTSVSTGYRSQGEPAASDRLEALLARLAERRAVFRIIGRWLGRIALVLLALGLIVGGPDPAGTSLFGSSPRRSAALVPDRLAYHLLGNGIELAWKPADWAIGGVGGYSEWGWVLLAVLAGHLVIGLLFPSGRGREIYLAASPVIFVFSILLFHAFGDLGLVIVISLVAALAIVPFFRPIGRPLAKWSLALALPGLVFGAPFLAHSTVNGQSLQSKVSIVEPNASLLVTLDGADPVLADQARYVRAQQAYLKQEERLVAEHLGAMTGAWRPAEFHHRARIDALAHWTRLQGLDPGPVPRRIAGGASNVSARYVLGTLLAVLGCALGSLALVAVSFCARLRRRSESLRSRLSI